MLVITISIMTYSLWWRRRMSFSIFAVVSPAVKIAFISTEKISDVWFLMRPNIKRSDIIKNPKTKKTIIVAQRKNGKDAVLSFPFAFNKF
jgi:hypothetical protein